MKTSAALLILLMSTSAFAKGFYLRSGYYDAAQEALILTVQYGGKPVTFDLRFSDPGCIQPKDVGFMACSAELTMVGDPGDEENSTLQQVRFQLPKIPAGKIRPMSSLTVNAPGASVEIETLYNALVTGSISGALK